jgi:cytidylate kinase
MKTPARMLTISHLYGSGGSVIARELGERLQWKIWDKDIVRAIASQYEVAEEYVDAKDERVDSFIERVVGVFGMGGFESAYQIPPPLWLNDAQLVRMTRTLIENIAQEGQAIVVGRGGQCILAGQPGVLHVFISAPLEARIERVARAEGSARAAAEQRVASMDRLRADYAQKFYHVDWRDPTLYHLAIDSAVWGDQGTVDLIVRALEQMPQTSA